ncbi:hypothetical protein L602_004000000070 [Cupriavidus gilardii J11]|uniref:Uncharacterized protein n=1 Tax=Cupriavidus gilardii J11 TaxID=936133 RepID=A0A562B925_9BURK|nr:hypothetical protein L602_004000000070 [Cupriavidus gilardii J11]
MRVARAAGGIAQGYQKEDRHRDRGLEQEDRAPADVVQKQPGQPRGNGQQAERAEPEAQHQRAALGGRGHQLRQDARCREEASGAKALHGLADDQSGRGGRFRAQQRAERKDDQRRQREAPVGNAPRDLVQQQVHQHGRGRVGTDGVQIVGRRCIDAALNVLAADGHHQRRREVDAGHQTERDAKDRHAQRSHLGVGRQRSARANGGGWRGGEGGLRHGCSLSAGGQAKNRL